MAEMTATDTAPTLLVRSSLPSETESVVAGLAPDALIIPVKVLSGDSGSGSSVGVANGIRWAADHDADIISMSLGGGYSSTIAVQVAYAIANGAVIAAAGNERSQGSPVSYPAALPGVVAVAATDSNNSYASFSNAGSYVDISAPGVGIWSTLPNKWLRRLERYFDGNSACVGGCSTRALAGGLGTSQSSR